MFPALGYYNAFFACDYHSVTLVFGKEIERICEQRTAAVCNRNRHIVVNIAAAVETTAIADISVFLFGVEIHYFVKRVRLRQRRFACLFVRAIFATFAETFRFIAIIHSVCKRGDLLGFVAE